MWATICLAELLLVMFRVRAFYSEGVFSVADAINDGAVYDGITTTLSLGFFTLIAGENFTVSSLRECHLLCLKANCSTFAIDRTNSICYLSSYDCKVPPLTYFRRYPDFITYEVFQGDNQPQYDWKKNCFERCLENTNFDCGACGRMNCVGQACDSCKKSCWEISPSYSYAEFWTDLQTFYGTFCNGQWQTAYMTSTVYAYPYMLTTPLWLQVVITLSNGTTLSSYFDSFIFDTTLKKIQVGHYVGGAAGNPWKAPVNLTEVFNNTTTCAPFFYASANCSITQMQIPTISNQIKDGATILKRGYVWNVCYRSYGTTIYVADIDLRVTPKDPAIPQPPFLEGLQNVTC